MKYNFKLKSFLRFKVLEEQKVKMRHAICLSQIKQKQLEIQTRNQELNRLLGSMRSFQEENRISCLIEEIRALEKEEHDLQDHLEQINVEHARVAYKKKALENLRDEQFKEFRRQETRKEQKKIEDIVNQRRGYDE